MFNPPHLFHKDAHPAILQTNKIFAMFGLGLSIALFIADTRPIGFIVLVMKKLN